MEPTYQDMVDTVAILKAELDMSLAALNYARLMMVALVGEDITVRELADYCEGRAVTFCWVQTPIGLVQTFVRTVPPQSAGPPS